ncbi:MAG: hypothetical protein R3Y58_05460 [Eubacteriales bacterium]
MNKIKYTLRDFWFYFASSRLLLFVLFQLTIIHFYSRNVIQFVEAANYPITLWILPFLFQNVYMQFVYGISVVYFFSTVPFFQKNQMYAILRQGRTEWIICKYLRIVLSSFALVVTELLCSIIVLLPKVELNWDWGKVLYSLSMTTAIDEYGIKIPIPYEILNNYSATEAMLLVIFLMFGVTLMLGGIMFAVSMLFSRISAVIVGTVIAIFPIVVANIYYQLNEITFFSPFSWLDILLIDGTRGGIYPALGQLVTVMLVVMISCGYMLYKKVKRVDFVWTQEQ